MFFDYNIYRNQTKKGDKRMFLKTSCLLAFVFACSLFFTTASFSTCPCAYGEMPEFLIDKIRENLETIQQYEIVCDSTPVIEMQKRISEGSSLNNNLVKETLLEIYGDSEFENKIHRKKMGEIFSLIDKGSILLETYLCIGERAAGENECALSLSPGQIQDICFISFYWGKNNFK